MRTMLLPLALAAAIVVTPAAASEDTQYWQTLNVGVALPGNFRISNETVLRTSEAKGFYEIENNFMVGKKVNKVVYSMHNDFVGWLSGDVGDLPAGAMGWATETPNASQMITGYKASYWKVWNLLTHSFYLYLAELWDTLLPEFPESR